MPKTDDLQELFDEAMVALPSPMIPQPGGLHRRLRRRKVKIRITGVMALVLLGGGLSLGWVGSSETPAAAVTLRPTTTNQIDKKELAADATILRNRLAAIGDLRAHVTISGNSIAVTGGPAELTDAHSPLLASPALLVRPVLCLGGPYDGSRALPAANVSTACIGTPYVLQPVTPDGNGYESTQSSDPALSQYPSTSPAQDSSDPNTVALLPQAQQADSIGFLRYLVGPSQLALTAKVASAQVERDRFGGWVVNVQLSSSASAAWDEVASRYFHDMLGVDLDGQIVTAPIIEPSQSSYTSFNGQLELNGDFSKATAEAVAATLQTRPLPIPLRAAS